VTVGLVTDSGVRVGDVGDEVARELPSALAAELTGAVTWRVEARRAPLLLEDDGTIPVFSTADEYRERHGWDVVVLITDLPRQVRAQPIVGDFSTSHRVALASLPALGGGPRQRARLRALLVHLIGHLTEADLGADPHARGRPPYGRGAWRLGESLDPTRHIPSAFTGIDAHLALTGVRGRLRLLAGMVHDNRPWRLLPHLASATAAAAATAAFGIFYSTIWSMAEALPLWRLALINVLAIAAMVGWLICYNNMWDRRGRTHQTLLYNASTIITLTISVACMYATLYVLALLAAGVVIDDGYLGSKVGHPVGIGDYAILVWLASSMGIVAGALGSSLDGEEAVLQATYSRREQARQARKRAQEEAETAQ
jgi:heme exporter protein D